MSITEKERFKIWETARKVCGYQQQLSFIEVIDNCKRLGKLSRFLLVDDNTLPKGSKGVLVSWQGKKQILHKRPPSLNNLIARRKWFIDAFRLIYACFDEPIWQLKPNNPKKKKYDEKKLYFAEIVLHHITHWSESLEDSIKQFDDPNRTLDLIKSIRKNRILLLGKYSREGEKRLKLIQKSLRSKGFNPIIFRELDNVHVVLEQGDILEEVIAVAKLSQMVIVEDSEASGHLLELTQLISALIPAVILRYQGKGSTILTESFLKKNKEFIRQFSYNFSNLNLVLDKVIKWFAKKR